MIAQVLFLTSIVAIAASSEAPAHHAPQPYKFGYVIKDKHGEQHREETGNGASGVKGSYGFTDDRGVHRQVDYVADHSGFRAQVKTNEPGTSNQDPAAAKFISSAPKASIDGPGLFANGIAANSLGNAANLQARSLGASQVASPAVPVAIGNGLALNGIGLRKANLGLGNNGLLLGGLGNNALLGGLGYLRYGY